MLEPCRCEQAQQELAQGIPGLPAKPGEAARKVLGFFGGSGSSPRAAGTCTKQAPARPTIVDSIQGQAWQPSPSSPRDPGTEQHSRAASPKLQAWIFAAGQTIQHISPTETRRGSAQAQGSCCDRLRAAGALPPSQRAPCGTQPESGGNGPWNKAPACRAPESSPKSFKSSQETDEGFRCHSPGTEWGQHSGHTEGCQETLAARGGGGGEGPLANLWLCSPMPADTQQQPGTCCSPIPGSSAGSGDQGAPANQAMEPPHQESPRDPRSQTSVTRVRLKHFLPAAFFGLQDARNRSFHEQTIPMAACRQPKKP